MSDREQQITRGSVAAHGRRHDDLTLNDIWRMVRRARWIGAFALLLGSAGGWIGGQLLGPVAEKMGIVDARVTSIDLKHEAEFSALRTADAVMSIRLDDLAAQTKLTSYLICTWTRRNDPPAVPAECNQVILDWRRGIR